MNQTTLQSEHTKPVLLVALELSARSWKLAISAGGSSKIRERSVKGGDVTALLEEIEVAKKKFGVADNAKVATCYEAGRDGFWLHRKLVSEHIENFVIDPSSIEVDRRARQVKTDSVDARKLVTLLGRHVRGDERLRVVNVPSEEVEDERRTERELERLKHERTAHTNRIGALLMLQGVTVKAGTPVKQLLVLLQELRLPTHLKSELERESQRVKLVDAQVRQLEKERHARLKSGSTPLAKMASDLLGLVSIGPRSAAVFVNEFFGWRKFKNRRQIGAAAGLTPTPYESGTSSRELGISKAGNKRIRTMAIEIAWVWVSKQPKSRLTQWFRQRFDTPGRSKRVGIVAVARKLLVELWKFLETGLVPEGARLRS